jgi:hypothetical protein
MADSLALPPGHVGLGVVLTPVVSDVFGHFGVGITLATNFLLVVLDESGAPVDRGTNYTLSYYDPQSGQQVELQLVHNPSVPYQTSLPENQLITFTLTGTSRYLPNQTASTTIAPNTYGFLQIKLDYPPSSVYATLIRKRLF